MIDIGGSNLPKAISSKSGAKLGKLYKKRGIPSDIGIALKQLYSALKAKPVIKQLNESDNVKYQTTERGEEAIKRFYTLINDFFELNQNKKKTSK